MSDRCSPGDSDCGLFALPTRLGGLGLIDPTCSAAIYYTTSLTVCTPLISRVLGRDGGFDAIAHLGEQQQIKSQLQLEKLRMHAAETDNL